MNEKTIDNNESKPAKAEVFSFDDASTMIDRSEVLNYSRVQFNNKFYMPSISFKVFEKAYRENPHLSSSIQIKRNLLRRYFKPSDVLSRSQFSSVALDHIFSGNGFLERIDNRRGKVSRLMRSPAMWTRRGKEEGEYYFIKRERGFRVADVHEFKRDSICHILEEDIGQEIYGQPDYIACLNSAWLNRDATLFRRKYYLNGSHAGFILYMTDSAHNEGDIDNIRQALKDSKGPGNFKNLFMYAPNGKKDGMQLIPISEVAAKDEIMNIKTITQNDVMANTRVPAELMGVKPEGAALGDKQTALDVFFEAEIIPLQQKLLEVNEWLGMEAIKFENPVKSELSVD